MKKNREATITEIENILLNYDLGELYDFEKDERGYINVSFAIQTKKNNEINKYFLRRYKMGIKRPEIEFEHSVINHLIKNQFDLVAPIIRTKEGLTFYERDQLDERDTPVFYAVFEFLPGEDKYTWVDPKCSKAEIENAARVLAKFHDSVVNITSKGMRYEPKIRELLPQIRPNVRGFLKNCKHTAFDEYLEANNHRILENCDATQKGLANLISHNWPEIVIHCDYHPGNLKFEGEQIVGIFDFDWSKIDLRCFDFALASWYFFTSWTGDEDGAMRMSDFRLFFDVYQDSLSGFPNLDPLNQDEIDHLGMMISAANLYVMSWTLRDFYAKDVEVIEYLGYLRHSTNFINWYENTGFELILNTLIE